MCTILSRQPHPPVLLPTRNVPLYSTHDVLFWKSFMNPYIPAFGAHTLYEAGNYKLWATSVPRMTILGSLAGQTRPSESLTRRSAPDAYYIIDPIHNTHHPIHPHHGSRQARTLHIRRSPAVHRHRRRPPLERLCVSHPLFRSRVMHNISVHQTPVMCANADTRSFCFHILFTRPPPPTGQTPLRFQTPLYAQSPRSSSVWVKPCSTLYRPARSTAAISRNPPVHNRYILRLHPTTTEYINLEWLKH